MTSQFDLISVTPNGFAGNNASGDINTLATAFNSSISRVTDLTPDGRYIAFSSLASDLAATDTNGATDVFVRDRVTGTTTLVSVNSSGTDSGSNPASRSPGPDSYDPSISSDGRYVAFMSYASDLVDNDTNGNSDVFVRDLLTGTTTLVSVNSAGTTSGTGRLEGSSFLSSFHPTISQDGRYVAFVSYASDLVNNDINGTAPDIFVRDLLTQTTTLVSVNSSGTGSGDRGTAAKPIMSRDGRYIAFSSLASDLVTNDTNNRLDVFVRDLQLGTTTLVSVNNQGESGNQGSGIAGISDDGRYVLFNSYASNLVDNDTNGNAADVFVRDLETETTTLVSVNSSGTGSGNNLPGFFFEAASISGDGRYVAFSSRASNLVTTDTNNQLDVFVRDLQTGTTTLASVNSTNSDSGNGASYQPAISGIGMSDDGRYVTFTSFANDLVPDDTNGDYEDVFVRDLVAGTTLLISNTSSSSTPDQFNVALLPAISSDGSYVIFSSLGTGLVENDQNNAFDIYGVALAADTINPFAEVVTINANPDDASVNSIMIQFSEAVRNVDLSDFSLTYNGSAIDLSPTTVSSSDGITWTLDLSPLTTADGIYELTLSSTDIVDSANNPLTDPVSVFWSKGQPESAQPPVLITN